MAAFYADENFRLPVVEALRRLGHEVLTCQEAGRPGIAPNLRNESSGTPAELRTLNQVGHNGQVGRAHVRANVAPSWSPRWSAENVIDPEPDLAREHRVTQPPTRPGERVSVA